MYGRMNVWEDGWYSVYKPNTSCESSVLQRPDLCGNGTYKPEYLWEWAPTIPLWDWDMKLNHAGNGAQIWTLWEWDTYLDHYGNGAQ